MRLQHRDGSGVHVDDPRLGRPLGNLLRLILHLDHADRPADCDGSGVQIHVLSELPGTSELMHADGARHRKHPLHRAARRVDRALERRMRSLRLAKGAVR